MKLWRVVSRAAAGWIRILCGRDDWRSGFSFSAAGATTALVVFATCLGIVLAVTRVTVPGSTGDFTVMVALALPLLALAITFSGFRRFFNSGAPVLDIMVPGIYLLATFVLIEGGLAMVGPAVMVSWIALAYMLYRLAQAGAGWNKAISTGFGFLTVVLLVAMRWTLYTLTSFLSPPLLIH